MLDFILNLKKNVWVGFDVEFLYTGSKKNTSLGPDLVNYVKMQGSNDKPLRWQVLHNLCSSSSPKKSSTCVCDWEGFTADPSFVYSVSLSKRLGGWICQWGSSGWRLMTMF